MVGIREKWLQWAQNERIILYVITDHTISGLSHTEMVRLLVEHGVHMIQLREKKGSIREFFKDASSAVEIAHRYGAWVIIDDRPDICLLTGADGVHLGEDDLPAEAVRKLMPDRIIGISTHTAEDFILAQKKKDVDYVSFGPMHWTPIKPGYGVRSEHEIEKIYAHARKPTCFIGGIGPEDIKVYGHVGDSVYIYAVIRGIWEGDPSRNIERYKDAIHNFR